jgi:hypothetical protein
MFIEDPAAYISPAPVGVDLLCLVWRNLWRSLQARSITRCPRVREHVPTFRTVSEMILRRSAVCKAYCSACCRK